MKGLFLIITIVLWFVICGIVVHLIDKSLDDK